MRIIAYELTIKSLLTISHKETMAGLVRYAIFCKDGQCLRGAGNKNFDLHGRSIP